MGKEETTGALIFKVDDRRVFLRPSFDQRYAVESLTGLVAVEQVPYCEGEVQIEDDIFYSSVCVQKKKISGRGFHPPDYYFNYATASTE